MSAGGIKILAKRPGRCIDCDEPFRPGTIVLWEKGTGCRCLNADDCHAAADARFGSDYDDGDAADAGDR